jgi:hypothetical protein
VPETINPIQELNLKLIRQASFNGFDGPMVVDSLLAHKDLWRAVIIDREGFVSFKEDGPNFSSAIDLIKLRDLESGYWNVDTLFILPVKGKEAELELLARDWYADEVDWYGGNEVAGAALGSYNKETAKNPRVILRVWWD